MTIPQVRAAINGLYAITTDQQETSTLLAHAESVLAAGAAVLQYRNKRADEALRLQQARALRQLTRQYQVPLIINDAVSLARQVDADGVHLGGDDGDIAQARACLGPDKIIGASCYNQLSRAQAAQAAGASYVAFGRFFASQVKPEAVSADVTLLQTARRQIKLPMVAIGGITVSNGAQLLHAGADALAVISAVFGAADPGRATQEFIDLIKASQKGMYDFSKSATV